MTLAPKRNYRVLAIAPSTRGFGFAVLEGKDALVDWGIKCTRRDKNVRGLTKVSDLMEHYAPDALALEDCSVVGSRRSARIRRFIGSVQKLALKRGIKTRLLSRDRIGKRFTKCGATTKYEIAKVIAGRFPELEPILPRYRKAWMSEDSRMQVFEAVAITIAFSRKRFYPDILDNRNSKATELC